MKIIYVIYSDWSKEQTKALGSCGIDVNEGYWRIDIEENDKNANALKLINEWGIEKFAGTVYEKKDFIKSALLVYVGAWENGYPQPEKDFSYMDVTYNTEHYCKHCGIGAKQKAPFRIKAPKWNNKKMFELGWVFDEIFVRNDIYEAVFAKFNISAWPVILYKKETVIENTVQLKIPLINNPLALENQSFYVCEICNRIKYTPQIKGLFPKFTKPVTGLHMFKCNEYFGSGGEAHQKVFLSKELWEKINTFKINLNVWPVEP